jgi:hypothetical protein
MIKFLLFLFFCSILYSSIHAQANKIQPPKDAKNYVEVDDDDHDFGQILYGKPVSYTVHIQNIGKDTLTLSNVQVSCGCTVPTWRRGPYAPRDTFSIQVAFNGYTEGRFNKTLTLLFNNDIVKILRFEGDGQKQLKQSTSVEDDGDEDEEGTTSAIRRQDFDLLKKML